jgi:nitrate reductase gamma subunit
LPKVLLAFLMPMLVFIGSLAASQWVLAEAVSSKQLRTALSCVIALAAAVAWAFVTGVIERRIMNNRKRMHS